MMALYAPKASESVLADGRLTLVHRFRILKVVSGIFLHFDEVDVNFVAISISGQQPR